MRLASCLRRWSVWRLRQSTYAIDVQHDSISTFPHFQKDTLPFTPRNTFVGKDHFETLAQAVLNLFRQTADGGIVLEGLLQLEVAVPEKGLHQVAGAVPEQAGSGRGQAAVGGPLGHGGPGPAQGRLQVGDRGN